MNPLALIPAGLDLMKDWLGGRREARAQDAAARAADAAYNLDARRTYAAEYAARGTRYAFDAFVDGINRLVRPAFSFGVVGLLAWAAVDPAGFALFASALAAAPDGLWTLLAVVVGFWFGGRLAAKDLRWRAPARPVAARTAAADDDDSDDDAPNAVERRYRAQFWPSAAP